MVEIGGRWAATRSRDGRLPACCRTWDDRSCVAFAYERVGEAGMFDVEVRAVGRDGWVGAARPLGTVYSAAAGWRAVDVRGEVIAAAIDPAIEATAHESMSRALWVLLQARYDLDGDMPCRVVARALDVLGVRSLLSWAWRVVEELPLAQGDTVSAARRARVVAQLRAAEDGAVAQPAQPARPVVDWASEPPWRPTAGSDGRVEDLALNEWVGQALGSASTCWEDIGAAGEFDSRRAGWVLDGLMAHLNAVITGVAAAAEVAERP